MTTTYTNDFKGKVAIVTGGASGIGRATLEQLSDKGAISVFIDIDEERGQKVLKDLENRRTFFYCGDVSDAKFVDRVVHDVFTTLGPPFILANIAGIEYNDAGDIVTMPLEKLQKILDVNINGYLNTVRAVVPIMESNGGGRIVNISSVQAEHACRPGTSYQVSKAAELGITNSLVVEYARKGIRVNTILPGAIFTDGMGAGRDAESFRKMRQFIPIGRRGHAYEVASLALFLLSDDASYCHGGKFYVDGGISCTLNTGANDERNLPVGMDPDF